VIFVGVAVLSTTHSEIYSQQQSFEEFMEWCVPQFGEKCSELYEENGLVMSEGSYDFVIVILVMVIGFAILGNYLWSKRKGRRYSEE
jgi:hypothetical protein